MSEYSLIGDSDMRLISNSQVSAWNTCRNQYRYGHDIKLMPKPTGGSSPLSLGTFGHRVLETYYASIIQGESHDSAVASTDAVYIKLMRDTPNPAGAMEIVGKIKPLMVGYFDNFAKTDQWDILGAEEKIDLPLSDEYSMPIRYDLLMRNKADGKVYIVDHKFTWEFWRTVDIMLMPQLPKYIAALRASDQIVDGVMLNQIRTRPIKAPSLDQLYRRDKFYPSIHKIKTYLSEHIVASREIVAYHEQPESIRKQLALRVANKMICKWCAFSELCAVELDGGETSSMIANDFVVNTYGYDATPTVEELV